MAILSGHVCALNDNETNYKCEDCEQPTPATKKMAGEVDSFGVEWIYLCDACLAKEKESMANNPVEDNCDHCGCEAKLRPYRDPDEGSHGPQYFICQPCYQKSMDYHTQDLEDDDDDWVEVLDLENDYPQEDEDDNE